MRSGYTECPRCGEATVSHDVTKPEVCASCSGPSWTRVRNGQYSAVINGRGVEVVRTEQSMWIFAVDSEQSERKFGTLAAAQAAAAQLASELRDCRICGGEGWTDGSAELRRDGRTGDTSCIGCGGSGHERIAQDAKRERDTGRYAPSVDRPCVCGHALDSHTAARVKGQQPCLSGDLTGVPCSCSCFKAARVKRTK